VGATPPIEVGEVDGVRLLTAPDGPPAAGLVLAVGQAHETLATRGITHLLEHLVGDAVGTERMAAQVDVATTRFVFSGADAARRLTALCEQLADPPTARLDVERRVLRAEAARNGRSLGDVLLRDRYGATGPGLCGWGELGLDELDGAAVRGWARERCRAASAVAWVAGPVPADLRLPLPAGPAPPAVPARPRPDLVLPAQVEGVAGWVAVSAALPDDAAGHLLRRLLEHRVRTRLRRDLGLVYDVHVGNQPIGPATRHLVVAVDAAPADTARVRDELVGVMEVLAGEAASPAELAERVRAGRDELLDAPARPLVVLGMNAELMARGRAPRQLEEAFAELAALGPDDVRRRADEVLWTALAAVPGAGAGPWPALPAPGGGAVPDGVRYPGRGEDAVLVVAGDAVALVGAAHRVVVPTARVVALVREGPVVAVVGDDGAVLEVDPGRFRDGDAAVRAVERVLPGVPVVRSPPPAPRATAPADLPPMDRPAWAPTGTRTGAPGRVRWTSGARRA
jgi:hypothetical protein